MLNEIRKQWIDAIGKPSYEAENSEVKLIYRVELPEFDVEMYAQPNGYNSVQRTMIVFPKNLQKPCPAVVVPYYFPEAMLGFDPQSGEVLPPKTQPIALHLVKRGYIAASAESFHLTYCQMDRSREDFLRWADASAALKRDNPGWTGIGKLISDTRLLTDFLCRDERVDASHIAIAGHSLGGKMAFYAGCLDERIKVILASDFGIGWDQTNWRDQWYWGDKVDELIAKGMEHSQLLTLSGSKPFCLLAGEFDNEESGEIMYRAQGYENKEDRLKLINHATGHTPPTEVLEQGYDFIDKWLKHASDK